MTVFMTMHPKYQGAKYRLFRALMFVATGMCGVAPLIHGLKVFGMPLMMHKAFPYTMTKAACLLSGVSFYAVSLPQEKERLTLTHVCSIDQVSRKPVSWQIRSLGLPFHLPRPGGMRRCGPVDGLPGCLRLCSGKSHLLLRRSSPKP